MSDRRLRATILVLSLLGAAVAGYLAVTHLVHVPVACATGGCETVQTSRYSELAGVPVAALGVGAYVVLAASAASTSDPARVLGFTAALTGLSFAVYLLYVQAVVLDAYCQWCLASDALLILLVPLTLLRVVRVDPPAG